MMDRPVDVVGDLLETCGRMHLDALNAAFEAVDGAAAIRAAMQLFDTYFLASTVITLLGGDMPRGERLAEEARRFAVVAAVGLWLAATPAAWCAPSPPTRTPIQVWDPSAGGTRATMRPAWSIDCGDHILLVGDDALAAELAAGKRTRARLIPEA